MPAPPGLTQDAVDALLDGLGRPTATLAADLIATGPDGFRVAYEVRDGGGEAIQAADGAPEMIEGRSDAPDAALDVGDCFEVRRSVPLPVAAGLGAPSAEAHAG